jgi:precorrin-6A/cobalt-precorrin-6A reductase
MSRPRILILGGSTEASALARALAADARYDAELSLAGRTKSPALPPIPHRIGGFGGIDGLAAYLRDGNVACLINATHPFAARMSANAVAAAARADVPLLRVRRPEWTPGPGDDWTVVADMDAAASALGAAPRRVLLTIGQKDLAAFRAAPQHAYVIRSVDPPPPEARPPHALIVTARGPFDEAGERALLAEHRIEIVVTKNSGGNATEAKLAATRALRIPVVMVARPAEPQAETVEDAEAALAWLAAHHAPTFSPRGA